MLDLVGMTVVENRRNCKMTILHRKGGQWHREEVGRIINGLMTVANQRPEHPEYIVLFGHHTKEAILEALLGGEAFTAQKVVGMDCKDLPFVPEFI